MGDPILGTSGVEIEFDTGRPQAPKREIQASRARQRLNNVLVNAWLISEELHGNSQLLKIWLEKYRNRLLELAQNDPICQALEEPIQAIRKNLEFKPRLAEKVAKLALGPQLVSIIDSDT